MTGGQEARLGLLAVEEDFRVLAAAAAAGARCPQNRPHGPLHTMSVSALTRDGRIRSEVFRHNWRVVTILTGEHAGKQTAPAPEGLRPWRVDGRKVFRSIAPRPIPGPATAATKVRDGVAPAITLPKLTILDGDGKA